MRNNRFTYLRTAEEERLQKAAAERLGMSESDVARWGVRKIAGELGIIAVGNAQHQEGKPREQQAA